MINFDDVTGENKTKYQPIWPYIPDHSYRILIIGGSGIGKTNALIKYTDILVISLVNEQTRKYRLKDTLKAFNDFKDK